MEEEFIENRVINDNLTGCLLERHISEELFLIYLRISAFLTLLKFNPNKKNKEIRIM